MYYKRKLKMFGYVGGGSRGWTATRAAWGGLLGAGNRVTRRRACSVFLFTAFFATTGLKPCCCGVLEGGVRGLMKRTDCPGCVKQAAVATGGGSSSPAPSVS